GLAVQLGEELAQVTHLAAERGGPRRPVVRLAAVRLATVRGREEVAVLLHRRATARRVDHDRVHPGLLEGGDGAPGEPGRLRCPAGMQRQRTAAALAGGDAD